MNPDEIALCATKDESAIRVTGIGREGEVLPFDELPQRGIEVVDIQKHHS